MLQIHKYFTEILDAKTVINLFYPQIIHKAELPLISCFDLLGDKLL